MAKHDKWLTLWVIEILMPCEKRRWDPKCLTQWEPTTGAYLTRGDARRGVREWHQMNPDDRFRVRPYVRAVD